MSTFIARFEPSRPGGRRAFTLVELMISIMIIAMMAGMLLFAVYAAQESAKTAKTRSLISKLDGIIMNRWESYRTRRVPITVAVGTDPMTASKLRLQAMHELMKYELPDRYTDINDPPVNLSSIPSVTQTYRLKLSASPTPNMQDAECLYLIVMAAMAEEGDAREMFKADNIKDTDNDGMMEFVDAWGEPIRFLRWAPGYISDLNTLASGQVVNYQAGVPAVPANPGPPPTPAIAAKDPQFTAINDSKKMSTTNPVSNFPANGTQFAGGALVFLDSSSVPDYSAKIKTYAYTGSQVTFTFSWDGTNQIFPSGPQAADEFVVLAPYQFDIFNQLPKDKPYPQTDGLVSYQPGVSYAPPSALYPLIYSSGPNRCAGVNTEMILSNPAPNDHLRYSVCGFNPFVVNKSNGDMIGTQKDFPSDPNYVPNGWNDNITNHSIGRR